MVQFWPISLKSPHTPRRWWVLGLCGTLLILAQPQFSIAYYTWNLRRGAYPIYADSISIPIMEDYLTWTFWAPIALGALWWAVWKYSAPIPIGSWNSRRPIWSFAWTAIFSLLTLDALLSMPYELRWLNLPGILNTALWVALFLNLRAVVIFKGLRQDPTHPPR